MRRLSGICSCSPGAISASGCWRFGTAARSGWGSGSSAPGTSSTRPGWFGGWGRGRTRMWGCCCATGGGGGGARGGGRPRGLSGSTPPRGGGRVAGRRRRRRWWCRRRAGGRDAVSRSPLVFVELDAAASERLLDRSPAPPSMLVTSGTRGHVHAYWLLREPVSAQAAQEANRMLALRIGGDLASVDAARILRPPQTFNHKHCPPIEVRLQLLDPQRAYRLEELTAGLEDQAAKRGADKMCQVLASERARRGRQAGVGDLVHEQLREIPASEYVARLTGRQPNREGKISCPFHDLSVGRADGADVSPARSSADASSRDRGGPR